jgi:aspartate/methionine/tyrosine aminotransferase
MDPAKPASEIAPLNQYARSGGHMPLVNALADLYSEPLKQKLEPSNVLVTGGASEALFAAGQAFLDPGDEVILFEPFFDIYGGALSFAGAKIVPVQLHLRKPAKTDPDGPEPELSSSMYQFNFDELSAAFNDKTKMIWINTPHNPTGKMFSVAELEQIASLVRKYPRVIVLSDEVYEWITFDGQVHHRFANITDMWERTLTVSSAAKTFSITGWKVGWALGPAPLIAACSRAHEYIIYCIATPLQESVAKAIRDAMAGTYFEELRLSYSRKRQIVVDALRAAGLNPIIPQGAFYVTVDVSHIELAPSDGLETLTGIQMDRKDWKIARWLTAIVGVTPIPCSAFYVPEHMDNASILRFAFCKTEELLHEAAKRFTKLPQHLQQSQQKRLQELQQ